MPKNSCKNVFLILLYSYFFNYYCPNVSLIIVLNPYVLPTPLEQFLRRQVDLCCRGWKYVGIF